MIENFRIRQGSSSDLFDLEGNIKPEVVLELGCWYLCIGDKNLSLYVCIKEDDKLVLKPLSDDSVKNQLETLADRVAIHEELLGISEGKFENTLLIDCDDFSTEPSEDSKKISARIIHKNAPLSEWETSKYNLDADDEHAEPLKKGELALAYVEAAKVDESGNIKTVPSYLIKIGDGVSPFKDLDYVNAPASDVYAWAKATGVKYEDGNLVFLEGNADGSDLTLDFKEAFYTKAELNNLLKLESADKEVFWTLDGGTAEELLKSNQ